MAYSKSSSIQATDFNTFAGSTNAAASSSATAQNVAGYLWGVGFGDRGYGQNVPALSSMSPGNPIGQEWQNLRTVLANLANWQNSSTTLLPPQTAFASKASTKAHRQSAPESDIYDIPGMLSLLDTNRLSYQLANMTLTSNAASSTRASTWGAGTTGISCTFRIMFASEDAARYFFNTGGQIRIGLSHPDVSTPRNTSWNTVLNSLSVGISAHSTTRLSGSYGTNTSIGYYELLSTNQIVYNGTNTGTGAYTVNDFVISAKGIDTAGNAFVGANGANGAGIDVTVTLTDEQTNAWSDIVAAGTLATISYLKASSGLTIAAPTCSVITTF